MSISTTITQHVNSFGSPSHGNQRRKWNKRNLKWKRSKIVTVCRWHDTIHRKSWRCHQKTTVLSQLCPTLCDPLDCSLPGSSVHGDSPGKNTGGGCRALLQGVFPTQELNPGLPHCRCILYPLSHHRSPGKTTELISEFGKIAGYRINAQKSAFPYTNRR